HVISRSPCSFIQSSGAHRDLHSFPTRRSSDLPPHRAPDRAGRDACMPQRPADCSQPHPRTRQPAWLAPRTPELRQHRLRTQLLRSEEHTSELQSRENLVCRLLLEKKKKKKKAT